MAIRKIALDDPKAAPNRVTTIDIAALLKEHGQLGTIALLSGVIVYLFKLLQDRQEKYNALLERVVEALADQKAAHSASTSASHQIREAVDKLGEALGEQSSEAIRLATETRHGIANLAQGQNAIAAVLEKLRDALDKLRETVAQWGRS